MALPGALRSFTTAGGLARGTPPRASAPTTRRKRSNQSSNLYRPIWPPSYVGPILSIKFFFAAVETLSGARILECWPVSRTFA